MTAEEAKDAGDVIMGTFIINSIPTRVLFDSGATYSFISMTFCDKMQPHVSMMINSFNVEVAGGKIVTITSNVPQASINIDGHCFPISLFLIPIVIFDVIIGMDWLSSQNAEILCSKKLIKIPLPGGSYAVAQGERRGSEIPLISVIKAQKPIAKGCDSYLAYVKMQKWRSRWLVISWWFRNTLMSFLRNYPVYLP